MITTAEITALNERLTKAHKANDALKVQREVHEKTLRDKARALSDQGIEGIDPDAEITVLIEQINWAFQQYSHDLEEQVTFNKQLLALVESGDYKGAEELLGTPSQGNSDKGIVKASAAPVTESAPIVPAPISAPAEPTPSSTQGIPMIQVKAKSAPVTPRLTQPVPPTVPATPKSSADLDSILNDALFTYEMGN
jgi:hypothetical protein